MMPKWIELADQAEREAKVTSAVNWLSRADEMTWLSEAVYEYQKECSPVKKEYSITLDPNSLDGSYALPIDYKTLDVISYAPPGSVTPYPMPVLIIGYDAFRSRIFSSVQGTPVSAGLGVTPLTRAGNCLYASVSYNKIWFWPFTAMEGVVTLRNIPNRKPYSPLNTEEWAGYGGDPASAMATFGPDDAFGPCITGIKAYCLAQILRVSPGGLREHSMDYQVAMQTFEKCKADLRRNATDFASRTRPKYNAGGTR